MIRRSMQSKALAEHRPWRRALRRLSPILLVAILSGCGTAAPSLAPSVAPTCSAASISDVLAALENVAGYTFTASGTSLTATPVMANGVITYKYQSPEIGLLGAYRAPDRSKLEVVAGGDQTPPVSNPNIFFMGLDSIVVIGDRTWLGKGSIGQDAPSEPGASNILRQLLRGNVVAGDVQWISTAACAFRFEQQMEGLRLSLQVEVGPGALPHRLVEEFHADRPGEPRMEYKLTYLPDFNQLPLIAAPGP